MALLRAREAVMGRFRPMLRDHDLTEQQWRVLRALTTAPEMRAGQLASVSFISMPSLSRILRILDDRGLILRRNEATDLRASLISLADDGAALIARIAPLSEAHYGEITDAYGPEALETLYRMLEDLTERLEVRPAERDDPGATT
ncbi:Transcriptional regulator SlyA [Oceanibacterium hippocampi]|uniref:Transcriptional regulator SlyA n=2 Tax=Oceanibacterium hippocampi TaxID=745714 RepID=A0A1Y5TS06_9PROT|nr:Transcriptional regulator SlyA [Oceanibacterium hippocampi]